MNYNDSLSAISFGIFHLSLFSVGLNGLSLKYVDHLFRFWTNQRPYLINVEYSGFKNYQRSKK